MSAVKESAWLCFLPPVHDTDTWNLCHTSNEDVSMQTKAHSGCQIDIEPITCMHITRLRFILCSPDVYLYPKAYCTLLMCFGCVAALSIVSCHIFMGTTMLSCQRNNEKQYLRHHSQCQLPIRHVRSDHVCQCLAFSAGLIYMPKHAFTICLSA